MLVNGAGVSPTQALIEQILKVDLYGTAVLFEEVGKVRGCWSYYFESIRTSYAGIDT